MEYVLRMNQISIIFFKQYHAVYHIFSISWLNFHKKYHFHFPSDAQDTVAYHDLFMHFELIM